MISKSIIRFSEPYLTIESFVWHPVNTTFTKDKHLAWVKESGTDHGNVFLDDSKMWITVGKQGVYLVYVQLTYSLKKDANSSRVDLMFYMEFNYTDGTEEFTAAFDTRQLTEKETDAHLSAFLLFDMEAGNRLSITAHPKEMIKYNDISPFSSYITIIRYADLQD